jgi:multiple sugar transport system permease protein
MRIALIIIVVIINIFPIYWMILTSFRPDTAILSKPPKLMPFNVKNTLKNYQNVLSGYSGTVKITEGAVVFIRNSLVVSVLATFVSVFISFPAAYAVVRIRFPGREFASALILICYLIPTLALMVPVFILSVRIGLQNTLIGLIIVESIFNLPIALWLIRGFLTDIPYEIEEAAFVDGCSRLRVMIEIVLPIVRPGITVVSLVCYLNAWNSYLFPMLLIRQNTIKTASIGMSIYLNEQIGMVWGEMMAAGTIIAIPVLFIYLFFQRNLIGGITAGAIKG